jgi:hypothetical protein
LENVSLFSSLSSYSERTVKINFLCLASATTFPFGPDLNRTMSLVTCSAPHRNSSCSGYSWLEPFCTLSTLYGLSCAEKTIYSVCTNFLATWMNCHTIQFSQIYSNPKFICFRKFLLIIILFMWYFEKLHTRYMRYTLSFSTRYI